MRDAVAERDAETFSELPGIARVAAYETGFAALTSDGGHVWTWGDGRYPACLGREVTEER